MLTLITPRVDAIFHCFYFSQCLFLQGDKTASKRTNSKLTSPLCGFNKTGRTESTHLLLLLSVKTDRVLLLCVVRLTVENEDTNIYRTPLIPLEGLLSSFRCRRVIWALLKALSAPTSRETWCYLCSPDELYSSLQSAFLWAKWEDKPLLRGVNWICATWFSFSLHLLRGCFWAGRHVVMLPASGCRSTSFAVLLIHTKVRKKYNVAALKKALRKKK